MQSKSAQTKSQTQSSPCFTTFKSKIFLPSQSSRAFFNSIFPRQFHNVIPPPLPDDCEFYTLLIPVCLVFGSP
uniref:Uncharacterized protein n=1 Tax=Rhizophora mucronata TaxID=61149 RepID=A0A2P2NI16_RHIMU